MALAVSASSPHKRLLDVPLADEREKKKEFTNRHYSEIVFEIAFCIRNLGRATHACLSNLQKLKQNVIFSSNPSGEKITPQFYCVFSFCWLRLFSLRFQKTSTHTYEIYACVCVCVLLETPKQTIKSRPNTTYLLYVGIFFAKISNNWKQVNF